MHSFVAPAIVILGIVILSVLGLRLVTEKN
jgi:hypothetical protein